MPRSRMSRLFRGSCRKKGRKRGNAMPTKSRAAVLVESRKPLVVDEVVLPDPAPDQVLV